MPTQKSRILLVDDDFLLQELIALSLEQNGFAIDKADDGQQAKQLVEEHPVDLILLDMMMPVMDGLKFLHWLRQECQSDIPVLALTAMERADSKQQILDAGASAVVFKPVDLEGLLSQIESLLP